MYSELYVKGGVDGGGGGVVGKIINPFQAACISQVLFRVFYTCLI